VPRAAHRLLETAAADLVSPNPRCLGGFNPLPTHPRAEGGGEGGGRRSAEAPGAAPPAAKPEPPARRSRTCGSQARLRTLCFHFLCRYLPRHSVAHLFTAAFSVGSRWTIGEHRDPSSLWCLPVEPGTRTDLMRRGQPERSRASVLADV
jgi:hypothetical protein